MLSHGGSPDTGRLAAEAAEEIGGTQFFEAEFSNPLENLEHYCRSPLGFQRLAYAQGIAAAALTADYQDSVEVLLPLVEHLTRDNEPEIRNATVQQLCGLGIALHQKDPERSLRDIEATLTVCAQQCAVDEDEEVSQAAILAFQQLMVLLPAARATAASKRAVDKLEARATDDGTLAAVRLLAHTVHVWTPEALRRHVPRYLTRWTNHRDFGVREAVGICMSLIVKAMPLQLSHQLLLPFFYQLCRDSNWRVRRACSADLPRLAQAMQQHSGQQQQQRQKFCLDYDGSNRTVGCSSDTRFDSSKQDGCCCTKSSSCLRSLRHPADLASLSTGNLQAVNTGPPGFNRIRAASAVNLPLHPATTEQISAKHPMHSSLIRDGLLASAVSPNSSTPPSPTSQQVVSSNDSRQPDQQQHSSKVADGQQTALNLQQHNCLLEAAAPVLHDSWCAVRQCMELLSADSSHWVKVEAMSGLGPFILALPSCQCGLLLLGRFTSMAGSTVVIYEISVALSCAQYFGPLVVRLGAERWPEMRDAWQALQMSRDPAVLSELIKCMPSLVTALGPAITCQELTPALALLLQSHLSWIAAQLVPVLGELMEVLPPSSQDLILKVLSQLASAPGDRDRSWRLRRDLALQLGRMAAAAGPEAVIDSIWPAAMTLCSDPVSAVRTAAAQQVGPLLAALPRSMLSPRGAAGSGAANGSCSCPPPRSLNTAFRFMAGAASSSDGSDCSSIDQVQSTPAAAPGGSMCGANAARCSRSLDRASNDQQHDSMQPEAAHEAARTGSGAVSRASNNRCHNTAAAEKPANVANEPALGSLASDGSSQRHQAPAGIVNGRSSIDYELDLPNALAPAPVDAFSARVAESGFSSSSSSSSSSDVEEESNSRSISSSGGGSNSSIGSDSDEEPVSLSTAASSKQAQYSAVAHPALQYQLPPVQPAALQQQQREPDTFETSAAEEVDIYNARRTVAVPQSEAAHSSMLPVVRAAAEHQRQSTPLPAVHPAMMPIGHLAMASVGKSTPPTTQPRPVPAATRLAPRTPPLAAPAAPAATTLGGITAATTGDLLHTKATVRHHRRPDSSCCVPVPLPPAVSRAGGSSQQQRRGDPALPGPTCAAPHQYLACLINHFGCSSDHQQRQLFVPLVMGILSACHDKLTCGQASDLLDSLEDLAADTVPGVRYAVAAALQHLKQHAVALLHGQQQHTNGMVLSDKQQHQHLHQHGHEGRKAHDDVDPSQEQRQRAQAAPVDSYTLYVRQLASHSGSVGCRHGAAADQAAEDQAPPTAEAAAEAQVFVCSPACAVCGVLPQTAGDGNGLEWLKKLCSCHQLVRLMGVVALTTGPL